MRIGVDAGGTWLRLGAWDGRELTCFERLEAARTPAELADAIKGYMLRRGLRPDLVAVGVPGTLDGTRRAVLNTPNLDLGGALADTLEAALGLPVALDNDVNAMLRGDIAALGRGKTGLVLGLYAGTGLGGAIFLDGKPLPTKSGVCEPGHMPIPGRADPCPCGGKGCAENYVSGRRLVAIRDEFFPGEDVGGLYARHAEHPALAAFFDDTACVAAAAATLLGPDLLVL
ncbi:MAG: ROK family protein, partial [Oscillospiraceae bacterium]|nr:ROK family protein [Oscillospiraceae bacterium]